MAVTPQEGWYIVDDEVIEGIDSWIISTSGNTTGDYFYIQNVYYTDSYTIGTTTHTGYTRLVDYWRGFSNVDFRIDGDWWVKFSVQTGSGTAGIAMIDASQLPILHMTTNFSANATTTLNYFEFDAYMWPFRGNEVFSNEWFQCWEYMQSLSPKGNAGFVIGTPASINMNDLIICCPTYSNSTSNGAWQSFKLAVVFACPKDKAPAGLSIGDPWPKVDLATVTVNVQQAISQWEQRQLAYSDELLPYGKTTSQLGALGSANNQIVSDVSDNAIGQFGVSNDQINNIADMLTGSFYLHVLTISGLFIVLLFFVKKGMA